MKKAILLVLAITFSSLCYAAPLADNLASAWKTQQSSLHAKENKNDINIVYGGADISAKPALTTSSTIA